MQQHYLQEKVLVVSSERLFASGKWEGLLTDNLQTYLDIIREDSFFLEREQAEYDPTFQQIIPYLVFCYQNGYFLIKKLAGSSEARLHHKYMMGVGGHINEEDAGEDVLEAGIQREWDEEVFYSGTYTKKLVGILSDSFSPVSTVHTGLVYIVEGDSSDIAAREVEKMSGSLVAQEELRQYYDAMDSWGKILVRWIEAGQPHGGIFN